MAGHIERARGEVHDLGIADLGLPADQIVPAPTYVPLPVYPAPAYVAPRVSSARSCLCRPGLRGTAGLLDAPYGYAPALSYATPFPRPPAIMPYGAGAPCAVNGSYGQLEYCD
jgi:hypothetical protein